MNDGTTPLILAVRLLVEDTVDDLMNLNAKVNAADKCGKTALHWAALVNNTAAITVLLEHNANKDAQNYQVTIFSCLAHNGLECLKKSHNQIIIL